MNHDAIGATETHSLPPEPAGPITIICAVLCHHTTPIVEATQLALPCQPLQPPSHWLSREVPHPASLPEWVAA